MALYFITANSLGLWLILSSVLALQSCDSADLVTSLHILVEAVNFMLLLPYNTVQSVVHGLYHRHLGT